MKIALIIFFLFTLSKESFEQTLKLPAFINNYVIKHDFNGTILIQKDSKTIYNKGFGIANREFNVPFNTETEFKVCSITKSFTAILILQLYEQGKIDLNQKIKAYLPSYKGEAGNEVSIHQLLNHTSGMRNTDTVKSIENAFKYGIGFYQKPYTSDQLVNNFCSYPLVNQPGKKFDYNNGEYFILGKILETIYKKPYELILNEKILNPLGMSNSGLLSQDKLIRNLASTYFTNNSNKKLIPDLPVYMQDWYAAGAMYSCTTDLTKFINGLFALKLVNKATLDLMLQPGLDDYGYSVWVKDFKGLATKYKRMERYGSIMGANSVIFRFLNKNVTVIILSNTNLTDLGDFALKVGKEVF